MGAILCGRPAPRERQSGFLFPEFGQSSRRGYFAKVPYCWAINDSQDLTVSLDTFSARGIGLDADYRYDLSREQRGELSAFRITEVFRNNQPEGILVRKRSRTAEWRWPDDAGPSRIQSLSWDREESQ